MKIKNMLLASEGKRISKGKQRAQQIRADLWPDIGEDMLWNRKEHDGYTTIPRTLPVIMNIIDSLSKNQPAGRTYFGLWARTYDESVLIIENPMSLAAEAGFSGERAVTTWKQRMKALKDMGFVGAEAGSTGEFHYVLIFNPHKVVWQIEGIPKQLMLQLRDRAIEVGATDMAPSVPSAPAKKPAAKKKQGAP
jgi:hypothetical protein